MLVPKDDTEFGGWQNLKIYANNGNIKYWENAQEKIYFVRPAISGIVDTGNINERSFKQVLEALNIASEKVILAKHFGNNATPKNKLIKEIKEINFNIVVLHYSLLIEGTDGHPAGIKKLYDQLSNTVEKPDKLFEELFQLFRLERRKKKYEDTINQIADFQLLLSSYLLLESIGEENKAVSNKQNDIKSQIKAEAKKFDEREAITSIKLVPIVENSFTSDVCRELNQMFDDEKNRLIDEYIESLKIST